MALRRKVNEWQEEEKEKGVLVCFEIYPSIKTWYLGGSKFCGEEYLSFGLPAEIESFPQLKFNQSQDIKDSVIVVFNA